MPCNLSLYPNDFPSDISNVSNSLELEILSLKQRVDATAIQGVLSRRIIGRTAALTQNDLIKVINAAMPLAAIADLDEAFVLGSAGYLVAGLMGFGGSVSSVDRLRYANESISALSSELSQSKAHVMAASSMTAGYVAGGLIPGLLDLSGMIYQVDTVEKLSFASETLSTLAARLSIARFSSGGTSTETHAFFAGSYRIEQSFVAASAIDKMAIANESISAIAATLGMFGTNAASFGNKTHGYFAGTTSITNHTIVAQKLNYASEALSAVGGIPAFVARSCVSTTESSYLLGGQVPSDSYSTPIRTGHRFTFVGEIFTPMGAELIQARSHLSSNIQSSAHGYLGGGTLDAAGQTSFSAVERLTFASERVSPVGATLTTARNSVAGLSNYHPSAFVEAA